MKATELMLGDWVMVNRSECVADGGHYFEWQEVGRIVGLQEGIITVRYSDHEDPDYIDWAEESEEDVKPYLLTKEILEKNGFYSTPNVGYVLDDYNGNSVIYDSWNHNLKITKYYKIIFDMEYFDNINVHKLQHVLRMCGVDKEIKMEDGK